MAAGQITQQTWPPNGQLPQQTDQIPGVPETVINAVIRQESGGRADPREPKGEPGRGLMQVTPQVAQQYGISPEALSDPRVNRYVGTRYLNELNRRFGGNLALTLAAYNAGPTRVARGEIPDSTRTYVRKILETIGSGVSAMVGEGSAYGDAAAEFAAGKPVNRKGGGGVASEFGIAKEVNPATPAKSTAEKLYERVRDIGRSALEYKSGPEKQLEARLQNESPRVAGMLNATDPNRLISRAVLPDDLTQFAESAGLTAVGGSELPMLARLAIPAATGAAGAFAQGERSIPGAAAEGAGSELFGETVSGLTGIVGRTLGKNKFLADTSRKFAGAVGDVLNQIGVGLFPKGAAPQSAEELERLFTRGQVANEVDRVARPISKQVQQTVSGMRFTVPEVKSGGKVIYKDVSLPEAEDQLSKLGDLGFTQGGGYKSSQAARESRLQAYKTRGQIAQRLNQIRPGMGDQWLAVRKARGSASALKRLFAPENGVISPVTGQIDQPKLVKAILDEYEDLSRNLGEARTEQLLRTARHNSNLPASDVPAVQGHLRVHGGVFPSYHPGSTMKPTGQVPFYMRQAARSPLRTPAALAIQRFIDSQGGQ